MLIRDDYMSSENFQKSEQTNKETQLTETVIIENMPAQRINGRYHFTNQSRTYERQINITKTDTGTEN